MSRIPNGLNAKDPFFERMMDERIATLRAFLRMTSQKYQKNPPKSDPQPADENCRSNNPAAGNVIHLRRKR